MLDEHTFVITENSYSPFKCFKVTQQTSERKKQNKPWVKISLTYVKGDYGLQDVTHNSLNIIALLDTYLFIVHVPFSLCPSLSAPTLYM